MKIELKNEKDKNKKLSSSSTPDKNIIDNLTNQLNKEKTTNKNLSKENINLKKKIEELEQQLHKSNKNNHSTSSNNPNEIVQLYKKIENLNEQLKRYPAILGENEKLISIIFASSDQTMHYSMICKNTDTISALEKNLYEVFPNFTDTQNIFLCKGTVISRFKPLDSYKIKNGDILVLNKRED